MINSTFSAAAARERSAKLTVLWAHVISLSNSGPLLQFGLNKKVWLDWTLSPQISWMNRESGWGCDRSRRDQDRVFSLPEVWTAESRVRGNTEREAGCPAPVPPPLLQLPQEALNEEELQLHLPTNLKKCTDVGFLQLIHRWIYHIFRQYFLSGYFQLSVFILMFQSWVISICIFFNILQCAQF